MATAGPDYILLAVGVLLFAGAAYGITTVEEHPAGVYQVTWKTVDVAAPQAGAFKEGTFSHTFSITEHNLTRVVISVTCSDGSARASVDPAKLTVSVTPPNGTAAPEPQSKNCAGAKMEFVFDLNPLPANTTVGGSSEDIAEQLGRMHVTNGTGDYVVSIKNQRGQTAAIPGAVPVPAASGTVEAKVQKFEAVTAPVVK
ncbi:MAG TPA: hypothetical protein VM889_10715 [Candidatus Thermoplasmatota archaeon]|nr:hypothetical protein [Candidatus Thermoplasmatota archaeon]